MKLLLLLLLIPAQASAECSFFEGELLFQNPKAFVRSPSNGMELQSSRYLGNRIWNLEGSMGAQSPLITCDDGDPKLQFQLGLEAGMWIVLGYKDGAFPLLVQDFAVSVPLSFKWGNVTGAIKWNHISAHLGDGMDVLLEDNLTKEEREEWELYKTIANDFDVDLTLSEPFAYSRDFVSGHLAGYFQDYPWGITAYVHGGWAYKIAPNLRRYYIGMGFEVFPYGADKFQPYYAQDITYNADTDSMDFSAQLGVNLFGVEPKYPEERTVRPRLALTGYMGSDRRGQLIGRRIKQVGIGLFF